MTSGLKMSPPRHAGHHSANWEPPVQLEGRSCHYACSRQIAAVLANIPAQASVSTRGIKRHRLRCATDSVGCSKQGVVLASPPRPGDCELLLRQRPARLGAKPAGRVAVRYGCATCDVDGQRTIFLRAQPSRTCLSSVTIAVPSGNTRRPPLRANGKRGAPSLRPAWCSLDHQSFANYRKEHILFGNNLPADAQRATGHHRRELLHHA